MQPDINSIRPVLQQELAKQDFELVGISKQNEDGSLEVQAHKLQPVATHNSDPLYMPVPVTLQVKMDDQDHILKLDTPPSDATAAADSQYKGLVERGEIAGLADDPSKMTTHHIVVNDQGQKVIRRKLFSAF